MPSVNYPSAPPASDRGALSRFTIVAANLRYGAINPDTGDASAALETVEVLREANAHVVLFQEMDARNPTRLNRHLRWFANQLGMEPILGPSAAVRSTTGNHTAILIRTSAGLRIVDHWPPPPPAGPPVPWCSAEITLPGLDWPLHLYSVQLNARSETDRRRVIEVIACLIAEHGQSAFVGGDFNGYPRADTLTPQQLAQIRPHLQLTRCHLAPDGILIPRYGVDDELSRAGLIDIAAHLPDDRRQPSQLCATGQGGARVDRGHGTADLARAAISYELLTIASDHDAPKYVFDLTRLR